MMFSVAEHFLKLKQKIINNSSHKSHMFFLYNIIVYMTNRYICYGVTLTTNQKVKLPKAFQDKSPITLHLSKGDLIDGDDLMLTKTQLKRI